MTLFGHVLVKLILYFKYQMYCPESPFAQVDYRRLNWSGMAPWKLGWVRQSDVDSQARYDVARKFLCARVRLDSLAAKQRPVERPNTDLRAGKSLIRDVFTLLSTKSYCHFALITNQRTKVLKRQRIFITLKVNHNFAQPYSIKNAVNTSV